VSTEDATETSTTAVLNFVSFEFLPETSRRSQVIPLDGPLGQRAAVWAELGLRAGVAVPIMAGNDAVGVLELISDELEHVDDELLELLLSVGTHLGRVVERERSEEARLRTLIDNMPASVYLRDVNGRFILVNRRYEAFWGLSNEEIRGKTLSEAEALSELSMSPDLHAEIDRVVLATAELRERETRVIRDGREHVLADVRFPVLDSAGRVVAIAGIDLDITTQKRSQAEMAELLRRVEAARDTAVSAASAKSRFLANMSHELRTPLNAIIGFSRIVTRNADGLATKQVDNLSKILRSAEQLLVIIDEILDLSRIDAGGVDILLAETDVADVISDVTASLEPLVERPRVQLRVDVDASVHTIVTDRDKLVQILLNLLSNAIKYTDDGFIEVRAEASERTLRCTVTDTGLGIAIDELDRIFDEFHRADSASARMRRGTGLGLTISRRLARALEGDVTVESRLGNGSTFTLELPIVPVGDGPDVDRQGVTT
jgi:PAS domain S-box-containing protein